MPEATPAPSSSSFCCSTTRHRNTINVFVLAENFDQIKLAAQSAHRSNNQNLILKSVMDMMKERYVNRNYEKISLDEIINAIELTELKPDMRQWIQEALASNPKIELYPEGKYLFKPVLGHDVCNRKQLLARLREHELKGLGGILVSDIKETVYNYEKAIKVIDYYLLASHAQS